MTEFNFNSSSVRILVALSLMCELHGAMAQSERAAQVTAVAEQTTEPSPCPQPVYPPESVRFNEQGTVVLAFLVDTHGVVIATKIVRSSGHAALDDAAASAYGKCKFPQKKTGADPAPVWIQVQWIWSID